LQRLVGRHFHLLSLLAPQARFANPKLAIRQRHDSRLPTVPANVSAGFASMLRSRDLLGGELQDRLDGRSARNIDDFIDGQLSRFDQLHHRQQKLSLLLEELCEDATVFAINDLVL